MEEHQLQHNGPIDEESSFVPFNNGVTNRGVVLVNNLGGLTERELDGVVAAVGRAPESRWCVYFWALLGYQSTRENQIPTPVVPAD
jgi:dihydroxyacetone kinase